MKIHLLVICFVLQLPIFAQEIVNIVMVGKNGITEDVKQAISFVIVKQYPANVFERLDYKMSSPLTKLRTYSDSNLSSLQGLYLEYFPDGNLQVRGHYGNNMKQHDWSYYNDTGKVVLTKTFVDDKLIKTEDPDTLAKRTDTLKNKDEKEATFKGGMKAWIKYLQTHLNAEVGRQSVKGGNVRVQFRISKDGSIAEVHLKRSVEFVLDEEALRVIRHAPNWIPAYQNGKIVNAYRAQPITFIKD